MELLELDVEKIKDLCRKKGWSDAELARRLGRRRQAISETFKRRSTTLAELSRIAGELGVSAKSLLKIAS